MSERASESMSPRVREASTERSECDERRAYDATAHRTRLPSAVSSDRAAALPGRAVEADGRAKGEIAGEFGLSRFKVARLIDVARSSGLVRIEIGRQGRIDVDLSTQLQDQFGLQHAIVVDTPDDLPAPLRQNLGRVAAELLAEVV